MFFVYLGKRVKYVNFIRAFGEPKKTRNCLFEGATLFFLLDRCDLIENTYSSLIFQKIPPTFFRCRRLLLSTRGVLFLKEIPPLFPAHLTYNSIRGMVDPFWGGGGFFWGQPWIWILASHKSSRFGHLASWMFVPAGLATCFNGATRRYLELCALPKHLRLRTTSTTLLKKPETVMFQKKAPWSWENFINYPCYPKNWQ